MQKPYLDGKENFMNVIPQVKEMGFSEAFIKMWEFYFVFCEAGFRERNIGDVQLNFFLNPVHVTLTLGIRR